MGAQHAVGDRVDGAPGLLAVGLALDGQSGLLELSWQGTTRAESAPAGHLDGGTVGGSGSRQLDDGGVGAGREGRGQDDGGHIVVDGRARVLRVLVYLLGLDSWARSAVIGAVADRKDGGVAFLTVDAVG